MLRPRPSSGPVQEFAHQPQILSTLDRIRSQKIGCSEGRVGLEYQTYLTFRAHMEFDRYMYTPASERERERDRDRERERASEKKREREREPREECPRARERERESEREKEGEGEGTKRLMPYSTSCSPASREILNIREPGFWIMDNTSFEVV